MTHPMDSHFKRKRVVSVIKSCRNIEQLALAQQWALATTATTLMSVAEIRGICDEVMINLRSTHNGKDERALGNV